MADIQLKYRPDIDGLRAIAVALVIAFHAFPTAAPGGFVGVDVFFVISGYLISNYIVGGLRRDSFSFLTFYVRRIKRIVPALSTVMLAVLAFGWFVLVHDEFKQLCVHIVASAGFVSNIVFWQQAGYFDTAAETKPLLHLWSLGVEEQFYLIWPATLWCFWKLRFDLRAAIITLIAVSFLANILLVRSHPSAAFYLPVTRLWEPAIGALLGLLPSVQGRLSHALGIAGLLALAAGVCLIDASLPYPGWWALLPVSGSALMIAAGARSFVNRFVLANKPFVAVGLISYPLYLWHWPILSYGHILAQGMPTVEFRAAAVVASVVLAVATYFIIENPLRHSKFRWTPMGLLASLAILGVVGQLCKQIPHQDHALRVDPATATFGVGLWRLVHTGCGLPQNEQHLAQACRADNRQAPIYLVWGDSKADAVFPGLVRNSLPIGRWAEASLSGCAPVTGTVQITREDFVDAPTCAAFNKATLQMATQPGPYKAVLIATAARVLINHRFGATLDSSPYNGAALDGLVHSLSALHDAGKAVYFLIDNPTLPDPKNCFERIISLPAIDRKPCEISIADHAATTQAYQVILDRLHEKLPYLVFVDPIPLLCDMRTRTCPVSRNGRFLYSYSDHLSDTGNEVVGRAVMDAIEHRENK